MNDRLALSLTHADGRVTRLGPDEFDPGSVPTGLSFDTSIPGGFKSLTLQLNRRIDLDWPDLNLLDDVTVYGQGNEIVWEGRWAQLPRSLEAEARIVPGAVGHSAALTDDEGFREIYVDRSFGDWRGVSAELRAAQMTAGVDMMDAAAVDFDTTTKSPALRTELVGTFNRSRRANGWYDARGIPLDSIYYAWKRLDPIAIADTYWHWYANLADGDDSYTGDQTADLKATGPGSGTLTATAATREFASVRLEYLNNTAVDATWAVLWTCLAVYGKNHGLTKRGTASATEAQGFYASDVIADAVSRAAPGLTFTTGPGGSIVESSFVIPQLAFKEPSTAADVVQTANAYHAYDWGVYDRREFFWRPTDPDRCCWEVRLDQGAQLALEGDQAEDLMNGVVVAYTGFDGQAKTVGPPGSGCDDESATLEDTDPANPVNAHGLRRWRKLTVSEFPTNLAGATAIGYAWFAQQSFPTRKGQVVATGTATHPTKGERPVAHMRAGDYVRIADHPVDVPRKITETSYSHDGRQNRLSVDNQIDQVSAILERVGVRMGGWT